MVRSRALLLGLTLLSSGCGPRARVGRLVEAGGYGEACAIAVQSGDPALRDAVRTGALDALELTVAMDVIPAEALGVPAEGYGTDWLLVGVAQTRAPEVASEVTLQLGLDSWAACPSCDTEWILAKLAPPDPKPSGSGAPRRRRGFLGALLSVGKLVGQIILLPAAVMLDIVGASFGGLVGGPQAVSPPGFTQLLMTGSIGQHVSTVPHVEEGLRCVGDAPCHSMVVFVGDGTVPTEAELQATVRVGSCVFESQQTLPLAPQETVEAAFAQAFPTEGRELTW